MQQCSNCRFWIVRKLDKYADGSERETYRAPDGKGLCLFLNQLTDPDFGCNKFSFTSSDHTEVTENEGAPWQRWKMGPCPECDGRGCHMVEMRPACRRCGGLGRVRHYDDGYIADTTWDHPKEKELKKRRSIDPGLIGTVLAPVKKDNGIVGDALE